MDDLTMKKKNRWRNKNEISWLLAEEEQKDEGWGMGNVYNVHCTWLKQKADEWRRAVEAAAVR
jgi:hypothetical protein